MTIEGSTSLNIPSSSILYQTAQKDALTATSKLVEYHLQLDSSYPQLIEQIGGVVPSVSGLNDNDYPGLGQLSSSLISLAQLNLSSKIALPAELVEQFGHMQTNCMMGLFSEINRAWVTVDSNIFIWRYEDGGDLAYFDALNEVILGVGLIKPKPGIFKPQVHYLLCLSTPVEIVILGVKMTHIQGGYVNTDEISVVPEPLFTIPTDNVFMLNIQGTVKGRIFLGAKDGCLYETSYQSQDSWFNKKCKKVNHSSSYLSTLVPSLFNFAFNVEDSIAQIEVDNSRHILYTRSEKGNIGVYDLGADGTQTNKVTSLSQNSILYQAQQIAKTIDKIHFKLIVSISVIEISESFHLNLVGITQTGVRLYFTTSNIKAPEIRPRTLQLIHVRLPPGFSANSSPQRPNQVHLAYYKRGMLLLASSQGEENNKLWSMSNDTFPFKSQLMEIHTTMVIDGHSWAMSEALSPAISKPLCSAVINKSMVPSEPPLVVSQHFEPPRKFVFLSTQGIHIITKLRPVDQLRQLLVDNSGPDCEAIRAFFKLHNETQACATCLILACNTNSQDKMVAQWATRAFLMYGGEPRVNYQQIPNTGSPSLYQQGMPGSVLSPMPPAQSTPNRSQYQGPYFSTPAHPCPSFQGLPYSPVQMEQSMMPQAHGGMSMAQGGMSMTQAGMNLTQAGLNMSQAGYNPSHIYSQNPPPFSSSHNVPHTNRLDVFYSGKHNGLYLYVSRILRPIWNAKVVHSFAPRAGVTEMLTSSVTAEELTILLGKLNSLLHFVEINSKASPQSYLNNPQSNVAHSITLESYALSGNDKPSAKQFQTEAEMQERASIISLQNFLKHVIEVLGLWKVLCDHQFNELTQLLNKETQSQLKAITVKDFVLSGRELGGSLVGCIINRYLEDHATTDAISNRLREVCPSIYKSEDAIFSKANEKLSAAKTTTNRVEKELLLNEALQLCKHISGQLNLAAICALFQEVHFYPGILELCESSANKRDPQQVALHFYRNGKPQEDSEGVQAFLFRGECYKCITDALTQLIITSNSHPQTPRIPKGPGPLIPQDTNGISPEEAKAYADELLTLAFQTTDELLHVALYSWMIEFNLEDKLLLVKSPYIQTYLKTCTTIQPDVTTLNLLRQYYELNNNYTQAAQILSELAQKHGNEISLDKRIEFLAHAILCLKSNSMSFTSTHEGEFLHDLEEKMEVARIQSKINTALSQKQPQSTAIQEAILSLSTDLLDITKLYEQYADQFNLPECKLAILHVADHYDIVLIESLWLQIIEQEINNTVDLAPLSRQEKVCSKIKSLGELYQSRHNFFPLSYLVKVLEFKTCMLGFENNWVFKTFLDIRCTLPQLMDTYHRLYKSKDLCWNTVQKPYHILQVLSRLIDTFLNNSTALKARERSTFINRCLDNISSYIIDLQSTSSTNLEVQALIREFKGIQARLERL